MVSGSGLGSALAHGAYTLQSGEALCLLCPGSSKNNEADALELQRSITQESLSLLSDSSHKAHMVLAMGRPADHMPFYFSPQLFPCFLSIAQAPGCT